METIATNKRFRSRSKFDLKEDISLCRNFADSQFDSVEAFEMGFSSAVFSRRKAALEASGALAEFWKARVADVRFKVLAGHMSAEEAKARYDVDMATDA